MHPRYFYSHASCEARLFPWSGVFTSMRFLLTRLLRGATQPYQINDENCGISTHTPLARRDYYKYHRTQNPCHFYSHASCEARQAKKQQCQELKHFYSHASCEARHERILRNMFIIIFLLTRLLRGATTI